MKFSVIINTCALGPRAKEVTGSRSQTPHAVREYALQHFILPRYIRDPYVAEVIVVGEWTEGAGYRYVPFPSVHFSCVDAIAQRQTGADAATGDILIFSHDDHILDQHALPLLVGEMQKFDVFLPTRKKWKIDGKAEILPNGAAEGYVSGHVSVLTRDAAIRAPWRDVAKIHTWDLSHTDLIAKANLRVGTSPSVVAYDIEVGTTGLE